MDRPNNLYTGPVSSVVARVRANDEVENAAYR
jgi:hypothetical protein